MSGLTSYGATLYDAVPSAAPYSDDSGTVPVTHDGDIP